jgi:hypothetical protein
VSYNVENANELTDFNQTENNDNYNNQFREELDEQTVEVDIKKNVIHDEPL